MKKEWIGLILRPILKMALLLTTYIKIMTADFVRKTYMSHDEIRNVASVFLLILCYDWSTWQAPINIEKS